MPVIKPCLIPRYKKAFNEAIKLGGSLDSTTIFDMTTEQRKEALSKVVGDNADWLNLEIERKMILKDQNLGLKNLVKKLKGIDTNTRDDLSKKIDKISSVMNNDEKKVFAHDVVKSRLKISITKEDANALSKMSEKTEESWNRAVEEVKKLGLPWDEDTVKKFMRENNKFGDDYTSNILEIQDYIIDRTPRPKDFIKNSLNLWRATRLGFDTMIGRQSLPFIGTKIWMDAIKDMPSSFKNEEVINKIRKGIILDPNYKFLMEQKYNLGLTVDEGGLKEENYESAWLRKIPFMSRFERMNLGMINYIRWKNFSSIIKNDIDSGSEFYTGIEGKKNRTELAKKISAQSGRGHGPAWMETMFPGLSRFALAPRWFVSRFNRIIDPTKAIVEIGKQAYKTGKVNVNPTQEIVLKNTLRSIGTFLGGMSFLYLTDLMLRDKEDVEDDNKNVFNIISSDFMKYKVDNLRIDITAGLSSLLTLIARMRYGESINSKGQRKKADSRYGKVDYLVNYLKSSRGLLTGMVIDYLGKKTFDGVELASIDELYKNPTSKKSIDTADWFLRQFTPLFTDTFLTTFYDAKGNLSDKGRQGILALMINFLGVNTSSYDPYEKKKNKKPVLFRNPLKAGK